MLARTFGFVAFALLYYAPYLLEPSGVVIVESRVRLLLDSSLREPAVQMELLRNTVAHLVLLLGCYSFLWWLAGRFSRVTGVGLAVSRLLFLATGWMLLVAGNRQLFPLSDYSVMFEAASGPEVAVLAAIMLLVGATVALAGLLQRGPLLILGICGLIGATVGATRWEDSPRNSHANARNVVIVGVDSLSAFMMKALRDDLPNIAALLDQGVAFERAYTPIGRTFPAWVSLLSGEYPADHGAVFNLRGMDRVQRGSLLSNSLQEAGYRTVFAIDERRFSNIDESFGFDRVVGPKTGALDFVLQKFNDTPMTNLLLQTSFARHLLPFSRLNVASHANYDAIGFVAETLAAVEDAERLMLAVHFESGHYPFKTRHAVRDYSNSNKFMAGHRSTLTAVDMQVGRMMKALGDLGYLEDALVILMSDHGEGFGEVEAVTTRAGESFAVSGYGHGTSVLSEYQNRIVLGMTRFRDGRAVGPAMADDGMISLTDLRSVIEGYVNTGELVVGDRAECMTVETGIRFMAAADYRILDKEQLAAESAGYYEVDSNGRLRLREEMLEVLVNSKDVGWRCKDRLTYYSHAEKEYFAYEIQEGGERLIEAPVRPEDVARIDAYKERLARTFASE